MTYDLADDGKPVEWTQENVREQLWKKKLWKEKPSSKIFMRLFHYIQGRNKEGKKMEMTVPVWKKMTVKVCSYESRCHNVIHYILTHLQDGKVTKNMCFYIAKESNPPEPMDPEVKLMNSEERTVFVKQFGGFAMQDFVWIKEAEKFRSQLEDRRQEVDFSFFWAAGYDPPWKINNRRNEVAFQTMNKVLN